MVNIIPFRAYRFNSEKIDDLAQVMAPPYDTISKKEQEDLYNSHEYNVVRLNKGKQNENDTDVDNCFTRAASYLSEWINKDILSRDEKPSFYLYEQEVTYRHTTFKNLGLVGLLELQEFTSENIFQCEKTNEKSKPARYELLENTRSNFSMINCIYMEYEKTIMNKLNEITEKCEPDMDFNTHETIVGEDVHQRLWVIDDEETISLIQGILKNHTFYIADGQTRYETSLEYKRICEGNNPNHTGKEPYNYIMALFTNAFNDGLIQLPVHRLVKLPKRFSEDFFVACAQDYFKVEKIIVDTASQEFVDTMKRQIATTRNEKKFAVYYGGDYFYRLTLKDENHLKELVPDVSDAYRNLDVTVLNYLILGELMGISDEEKAEMVDYTTRSSLGAQKIENGEYSCMIVTNPVRSSDICAVATEHERMPEKSMFIFPKASTGVLIYKMEE